MADKKIYLSIIIPSYNETENLKRGALSEVEGYLKKQKYPWEVIVSDDGSPIQESRKLAKDFCDQHPGFVYVENEHGGKPFALLGGIDHARGELILLTDLDQSTPLPEVEKLLPYFDQGFDIVIGSRGTGRKNSSPFRTLASFVFRTFRRFFLLPNIIDTQCGFKSMRRTVAREIFPRLEVIKRGRPKDNNWHVGAWDGEMLYVAEKFGYKIKEVSVEWENRDLSMGTKNSTDKGKFVKESIEMVQEVVRVRLNNFRGYYQQ